MTIRLLAVVSILTLLGCQSKAVHNVSLDKSKVHMGDIVTLSIEDIPADAAGTIRINSNSPIPNNSWPYRFQVTPELQLTGGQNQIQVSLATKTGEAVALANDGRVSLTVQGTGANPGTVSGNPGTITTPPSSNPIAPPTNPITPPGQ